MFDYFEEIRIISLPDRKDRRRAMLRELGKVGLQEDRRVRFFDAIRAENNGPFSSRGVHGCFLSHLQILVEASGRSVLILEDDCLFAAGAQFYIVPDCDIFYGGYMAASNPLNPADGDITGSHCMGFSANGAEKAAKYLEQLLDPSFPPDPRAALDPSFSLDIRPPIDGAYVWLRRRYPDLVVHFAPHLSTQRSSRSDITPGKLDRIPGLKTITGVLRRLNGRVRSHAGKL
jgi:glycosyl transferase family 25